MLALLIALLCVLGLCARPSGPAGSVGVCGCEGDAIDRAHGNTQFATGAMRGDDAVHPFMGANDGISRTGFDAKGATYAPVFFNEGKGAQTLGAIFCVEGLRRLTSDSGQPLNALLPTGWALVDGGAPLGDSAGISRAIRVAAAGALCLGQGGINAQGQRLPACCLCACDCLRHSPLTFAGAAVVFHRRFAGAGGHGSHF